MDKYHHVYLRIKQEIWEKICRQAHEENRSYSNMIATIIKGDLADRERVNKLDKYCGYGKM